MEPTQNVARKIWRGGRLADGERTVPEETAIAFTYNGTSYAVMMATPQDLEDFAVGFSITESVIKSAGDIETLDIIEGELGIELQMRLAEPFGRAFQERRRHLAGPTGCGLCGIESLGEAMRMLPKVSDDTVFTANEIMRALDALYGLQAINQTTRAVHAAACYRRGEGIVALREDVGRHNALDKLTGALARKQMPRNGLLGLMTSRLSVELVQKAATAGLPVLVAVSAPTALAIRTAQAAGITLVGIARDDGFEIFTHPHRIQEERHVHSHA